MSDFELQIDENKDVIDQLADSILILNIEAQMLFAERYADLSWSVDIQDDQQIFAFARQPEPAQFRAHFVGSSADSQNGRTWMWAWNNINDYPPAIFETAAFLRDVTADFNAPELATAKLPLDPQVRAAEGLPPREEIAYSYATMAASDIDAPVVYKAPTGGGSFFYMLLDNPAEFSLPPANPGAIVGAITQTLETGHMKNHRGAVLCYGGRRDGVDVVEDGAKVTLQTAQGGIDVHFDDQDRIVRITGTITP